MYRRFLKLLIVAGLALAAVLALFSPLFYITEIKVTGNESIPTEEILKRAGFEPDTNLILFNTGEARKRIMENLYVGQVNFVKNYPNGLNIVVEERHLSGYVEYMQDKYLYIDENGRVLEINSFLTQKLPIVSGLKYDKIRLGELLEVEDADAFKTVVSFARLLNKYEMTDRISRIDVSESGNAKIVLHNIEISIGGYDSDADEKIRTIKEIAETVPNIEMLTAFLDLREIRSQYVLKMLI